MSIMILSRQDGSRIASLPGMSNVVKQGERINVNIVQASKNASLPVNINTIRVGTINTDQFGNGNTSIVMDVQGGRSYTVNVPDVARSESHIESVFVQSTAPTPTPSQQPTTTSTTPSQTTTTSTTPSQTTTTSTTPSQTTTTSTTPSQTTTTSTTPSQTTTTTITTSASSGFDLMNKAKEVEEWFRRNLIPVLFIALGMVLVAVFAGTKAGRQVVKKAVGAPIKR